MDCGPLPDPKNGEKTVEGKTTFGGRVMFRCRESSGYEIKGFKLRICGADGRWNGTQPTCQCKCSPFADNYIAMFLCS